MARIKYSALIDSIAGSVAGTTFQRNKYGHTIKTKSNRIGRMSPVQQQRKLHLQKLTAHWRTLSEAQRQEWATWANVLKQPTRHNRNRFMSGYQLFVRYYIYVRMTGNQQFSSIIGSTPGSVVSSAPVLQLGGPFFRIIHNTVITPGTAILLYFLTPIIPPGRTNFSKQLRFLHAANIADSNPNITSQWQAQYGDLPQIGDLIGVQIIVQYNGRSQITELPALLLPVTSI